MSSQQNMGLRRRVQLMASLFAIFFSTSPMVSAAGPAEKKVSRQEADMPAAGAAKAATASVPAAAEVTNKAPAHKQSQSSAPAKAQASVQTKSSSTAQAPAQ